MSEHGYGDEGRCPDCDGTDGNHYSGCMYEGTGKNEKYPLGAGNGISTMGAIFCTIASFVGAALVFVLLGIDVENVPIVVFIIVMVVIAIILGVIGSARGW